MPTLDLDLAETSVFFDFDGTLSTVDIGKQVPAEQYAAVAEVIRYVYQLKKKPLPGLKAA